MRDLTRTRLSRRSRTDCTRFVFQNIPRPFLRAAGSEQADAAAVLRQNLPSGDSCFESWPGRQFRPIFVTFLGASWQMPC